MDLKAAIACFSKGYFSTNDRQPKTKAAYNVDARQFERFVGSLIPIKSLTNTHIENWAAFLKSEGYSPASIRRKLVVLKVFCQYWVRNGLLDESPFWRVKITLGKTIQLPRTLSESEMRCLLKQAHSQLLDPRVSRRGLKTKGLSREFLALRNKAIIEALFATGMRVGELSMINVSDFIVEENAFRVQGKGRRERLAFVVDKVASRIQVEYLKVRKDLASLNQALFLNASGGRLTPQGIANVLQSLQEDSGIDRKVTPHMLRHTVATLLLRNGTDIRVVQEFLGHASIATTQRYTHVTKEHLKSELALRHPSLNFRKSTTMP